MSDVQSDTHPHKAKDGKWYPTYMEKVSANIAVNERVLREKGLDKAVKTLKKANCTNRNKMKAAREKKQPQRLASLANQENSSPSVRRSTRVRKKPAENKGLPDDFKEPSKQQLAAADKKRAAEETKEEKEWKRQRTQRLQAYKKAGMLTEQDRKYVDKIGWWREMKEFLLNEQKISDQNFKTVVRQIEKLLAGKGIEYHHWKPGTCFMKGIKVTLDMDMELLHAKAAAFEKQKGKDLGNGWLMLHPIHKLGDFKRFRGLA